MIDDKIRCRKCGKFISYEDLDSDECKSENVFTRGPEPDLSHVDFWCKKCSLLIEIKK